ncbi:MAG: DUF2264 domain-containing protein [Chitinophagaceae bacterium]|nr:DUF2264 domain-containing protein [Chitinophagaceae bacterium]
MKRKHFLRLSSALGLAGTVPAAAIAATDEATEDKYSNDRAYWVQLLSKISEPILSNMSKGQLRKNMPMQFSPGWGNRNKEVAYMEAIGRLLAGIAPFLNLPADDSSEGKIRKQLIEQSRQSLVHAVDPSSPDYLYWGSPESRQPLVDAAFLAQGLLIAPDALWHPLDALTRDRYIKAFKKLREIQPYQSNWLLFAAIIETFLLSIGESIDANRIDTAIQAINKWYAGDGWYKDGENFHFDHYNGYVIQPMLTEVLRVNVAKGRLDKKLLDIANQRMQRYAQFQERFISPEGYYPVFGRSSTYRAGLFWPLVKLALEQQLPKEIKGAQVRSGLTAVLKHLFIPTSFTKEGCLTLGLVGDRQSAIADVYTNTGSLYITSMVFWALGLPATDPFWSDPSAEWTQRKAWAGKPFPKDYAVNF